MENTVQPITDPAEAAARHGVPWPADACRCCGARVIDGTCLSYESDDANAARPANCTCPAGGDPMTTVDTPMARRDVWLTVALAVARDGMPVPDEFEIRNAWDDIPPHIELAYNCRAEQPNARPVDVVLAEAAEAARVLGLEEYYAHPDGFRYDWSARRGGWVWTVVAWTPRGTVYDPTAPAPSSPLAEQVVAAIGGTS